MDMKLLFDEYVKGQFFEDYLPVSFDCFEYRKNADQNKELFFIDKDEALLGWDMECMPDDPNYSDNHHPPLLKEKYSFVDVYDELTLSHLLYTINSATFSACPNEYTKINIFMKQYCFFQLSQISHSKALNRKKYEELRELFWFFFLYTHPVNGETLYSCTFESDEIIYRGKILLSEYFDSYYDFFTDNYEKMKNKLNITPVEIKGCKQLTGNIIRVIEGKAGKLSYFKDSEDEAAVLEYINNIDFFLSDYKENPEKIFNKILEFSLGSVTKYRDFLLSVILQNYVCYILGENFNDLKVLSDFLFSRKNKSISELIINKIFSDSILAKKFFRDQSVDIKDFSYVVSLFNEESKRINL